MFRPRALRTVTAQPHSTISSTGRELSFRTPTHQSTSTVFAYLGSFLHWRHPPTPEWRVGGEDTRKTLLLVQCLGPEQSHLGVIFTPSNAGNRLSAPRIDAHSTPPTKNMIQDALKDGEWSNKEGVGRDRLPGGRHRRLGWGSLVLS